METKVKYSVTNISDTYISMQGRTTLIIPNKCENYIIELNPATAKKTLANLRGRFPFLQISEVKENAVTEVKVDKVEEANVEKVDEKADDKADAKSSKKANK